MVLDRLFEALQSPDRVGPVWADRGGFNVSLPVSGPGARGRILDRISSMAAGLECLLSDSDAFNNRFMRKFVSQSSENPRIRGSIHFLLKMVNGPIMDISVSDDSFLYAFAGGICGNLGSQFSVGESLSSRGERI